MSGIRTAVSHSALAVVDPPDVLRCHAKVRIITVVFIAAIFLLMPRPAVAQVFIGPAASGAGSAGRAAIDPGEIIFLNPAAVAYLGKYEVSVFGEWGSHPLIGTTSGWGASIADGSPGNIAPGAVSFIRQIVDPPSGLSDTTQDIQVNIAYALAKTFAIGFTPHQKTDQILSNLLGSQYSQINAHFGALYVPRPYLGLGFVAYDFLPTGDGVPVPYHVQPTLALAGNFAYEKIFRARFDLVRPDTQNDQHRINVAAGLETSFAEFVFVRVGGYWKETVDQDYFSVGLGYAGPRLSIDYSFQQDARNGGNSRHVVDLWMPI